MVETGLNLHYFGNALLCYQENHEHLKYLRNVYRVMTNHSKDQAGKLATNHKLINFLACGSVFSHLIGFSLATQYYFRNISGVLGFPGLTVRSLENS